MAESKSNRFTKYFPLLLDALRSTNPKPMRPAEARAWIRSKIEVPADDLTRLIEHGKQSIFENDVHWARFYLAKANLIASPKRGLWGLTTEGVRTWLNPEETLALYVRVRDANRLGNTAGEEQTPAPDTEEEAEDGETYWFAGAVWDKTDDQMPNFLAEGIWENGYEDQFSELVRRMKPGDRIAIKASFVQKRGLPFDVGGKPVSVMRIKATGTILENSNDGKRVRVAWDAPFAPRDWYFYTYRTTVVEADTESEGARRLVDFTFRGEQQDYAWFLSQPYLTQKYGLEADAATVASESYKSGEGEVLEADDEPTYTIDDIISEGSFLAADELRSILDCWRSKKNLVLQGPPGTGKTWLAKRLGFDVLDKIRVGETRQKPLGRLDCPSRTTLWNESQGDHCPTFTLRSARIEALRNLPHGPVEKLLQMRLDAFPVHRSAHDNVQIPSIDKQNEAAIFGCNSSNVLVVGLLFLLSSVRNHYELSTCTGHVICRLVEIVGSQVRVILALPDNLYSAILVPHQLPESFAGMVRGDPVADHPVVDRPDLGLDIRQRAKEAQTEDLADEILEFC